MSVGVMKDYELKLLFIMNREGNKLEGSQKKKKKKEEVYLQQNKKKGESRG
jgi:hypothetical protein